MALLMTRGEAARALGVTVTQVIRLEKSGVLPVIIGADRVHRFEPLSVELARTRPGSARARSTKPRDDGGILLTAADVAELVALGCASSTGELDGAAIVATFRRLRDRLRHLRSAASAAAASSSLLAELVAEAGSDTKPREPRNSRKAASTTLETVPSDVRSA
jgi:hypothetical protein